MHSFDSSTFSNMHTLPQPGNDVKGNSALERDSNHETEVLPSSTGQELRSEQDHTSKSPPIGRHFLPQQATGSGLIGLGISNILVAPSNTLFAQQPPSQEVKSRRSKMVDSPDTQSLQRSLRDAAEAVEQLEEQVRMLRKRHDGGNAAFKQPLPVPNDILKKRQGEEYRQDGMKKRVGWSDDCDELKSRLQHATGVYIDQMQTYQSALPIQSPTTNPSQWVGSFPSMTLKSAQSLTSTFQSTSPIAIVTQPPSPSLSSTSEVDSFLSPNLTTGMKFNQPDNNFAPSSYQGDDDGQVYQSKHHRAVVAGIAGGVTGAVVLGLALVWIWLLCRKKRTRQDELDGVLDRVAPPSPSFGPGREKDFARLSDERKSSGHASSVENTPPVIEVRLVPSFEVPRMQADALDLDGNGRHSAELQHSRIVGQTVSRDLSFSWQFPQLSVPPAAARAHATAHYVKRRTTVTVPRQSMSAEIERASPSLSLSSAAEIAAGKWREDQTQIRANETSFSGMVNVSTTNTNATAPSAATASSGCIDPLLDHTSRSFITTEEDASKDARASWWNITFSRSGNATDSSQGNRGSAVRTKGTRAKSSPPFTESALRKWYVGERKGGEEVKTMRDPIVLAAHDPVMQAVMERMMAAAKAYNEINDSYQSFTSDEYGSRHANGNMSQQAHMSLPPPNSAALPGRRGSWTSTILDTCREESQDDVLSQTRNASNQANSSHNDFIESVSMPSPSPPPLAREHDGEHASTASRRSSTRSRRSIIIHDNSDEEEDNRGEKKSGRRSLTPKIMLTTSEEEGQFARAVTLPSLKTQPSTASDLTTSFEMFETVHRTDRCDVKQAEHDVVQDDLADAIGHAFLCQSNDTENDERMHPADADSTLDSVATSNRLRGQRDSQTSLARYSDSSFEMAFNEAFSEAAADTFTTEDDFSSSSTTSSGDEKSLVTARPHSVSPSETGTLCLLDDDFPTIPSWKSLSTQESLSTLRSSKRSERHAYRSPSARSFATIRQ